MNPLKLKNSHYLIALLGYFIVAFFMLRIILFSPGTVGFFHDWFIGPYPEMSQFFANSGLYIWDSQAGNKLYPVDWIFRTSLIPFTFLGGEVLSKGFLFFTITLSGFGTFYLTKQQFKLDSFSAFVAGILYIFSPIIFSRIIAGYIYYLLAYSLSPYILSTFLKGTEKENNNKYFVISGLLTSFAIIQIQFLPMIFIILLVFSLVNYKRIKKSIMGLAVVFSLVFLINLSPLVFSEIFYTNRVNSPFNPLQLLSSYHGIVSASNLTKSLRLLGNDVHPYSYTRLSEDGFIPSWIFYLDFIIPIAGFSSLFFVRNRHTISAAAIAVIGLFILKGLNPPLSIVFKVIFTHGFYIFRDVWHAAFLYGFSLSVLIAFSFQKILYCNFKNYVKVIFSFLLVSLLIISNAYPLMSGNFSGYFQTYNLSADYRQIYDHLLTNETQNTLILPLFAPIRYSGLRLDGVDPLLAYSSSNIFYQHIDALHPLTSLSTWIYSMMQENKTTNLGNLLSGFGIKYIVLRKDFVSNYPNYVGLGNEPQFRKKWYSSLEPFLNIQKDLVVTLNTAHYKIYKNINDSKKIFVPLTVAYGLSDFNDLLTITNLTSLSNVAAYQSEASDKNQIIELGKYTTLLDPNEGWTNIRYWFGYDYLLASRIYQGAFSMAANSSFEVTIPKYDYRPVEIWMRVLKWPKGGDISINVNRVNSSYNLLSSYPTFSLIKIFDGGSNSSYHFLFRNIFGQNYIEGIYIKEKAFIKDKSLTDEYQNLTDIVSPDLNLTGIDQGGLTSQQKPAIIYKYSKLNPTLWKIHTIASKPFVLSFAESYDPLWEARVYKDGKKIDVIKSTPVYGVMNGFLINKTGNLDIVLRYGPQDGYENGLLISGVTLAFCLFYFAYDWKRQKQEMTKVSK